MEQTYPGVEDWRKHFLALRDAFLDPRYIRMDGHPVFVIYRPADIPEVASFIETWQELARRSGLSGIHFVAHLTHKDADWDYKAHGFDSCTIVSTHKIFTVSVRDLLERTDGNRPHVAKERVRKGALRHWGWRKYRSSFGEFSNVRLYGEALPFLLDGCNEQPAVYPCVTPNWDNTPRSNVRGYVLHESTPDLFRIHLKDALHLVQSRTVERRLVFIKSWNEWAESNYLEPDQRFGHDYLKVLRDEVAVTRSESSLSASYAER